jgi:hypothetical protein
LREITDLYLTRAGNRFERLALLVRRDDGARSNDEMRRSIRLNVAVSGNPAKHPARDPIPRLPLSRSVTPKR